MNAVYSNKSFLRVLMLNEMNALDKIKHVSLPNPEVLEKDKKFKNKMIPNPDEKMCIIRNTGIWIIKEDLVNNIVIIARSGTKKFIKIGQFGVGFYSAYLVIERVVVRSKQSKSNENEQHVWKIKASGTFREKTVKEIVRKHSQLVVFLVNLLTIKEEEKVLRWCLIYFGYTYIRGGEVLLLFFKKKKKLELLFVPKKAPLDQTMKEKNIKLFVPRVFIVDDCKDLSTGYLSFIRCLEDIECLPLTEGEKKKVAYESLTKKMKEILGHKVEKVIVVYRMVYLPCSLATRKYGWSANIERIIKAQALRDNSMTQYVQSKKTIEEKFAADPFDKTIKDMLLLFETALLTDGFSLEEPVKFDGSIHKLIKFFIIFIIIKNANVPQEATKKDQKNKRRTNQTMKQKMPTWKRKKYHQCKKLVLCKVKQRNGHSFLFSRRFVF
ncbi:hypothetical protein RFI_39285 [Reticulomyxa filosa]|uniref:Heat shock protein 90 n=1 Tax=Reticulomyxa filosa TaxID=46433 RepID=X6LA26_RETFI|nr:hypothetical protein RFI_39285 [Reticulomyxa filosa]|eukprot:ETN98225.1 hypothetical protein RFI_39285 [Reticulomyxa filosa]